MSSTVKAGDLLIATISLIDPNFQHSVILLCQHDEDGSYGLVLNRPIETPDEILDDLPFIRDRLFLGGPVKPEAMQVLHCLGSRVPGAVEVVPGLFIGGDFDVLKTGLEDGSLSVEDCRFFLGYSGWAKGQLASELTSDAWLVAPANAELIVNTAPDALWARAIRECGLDQPLFASFPDNPSWN